MVSTIVKVEPQSDWAAKLLSDREVFESFARQGLHQPTFDLEDELYRPYGKLFVAWSDAQIPAGLLSASRAAAERHILSVAVNPALRRLGLGRALVSATLTEARAMSARLLFLEVRRSNIAAIRLYRKCGFVAVNVRKRYYTDNDEDAVEMAYAIDPDALKPFGPPVDDEI